MLSLTCTFRSAARQSHAPWRASFAAATADITKRLNSSSATGSASKAGSGVSDIQDVTDVLRAAGDQQPQPTASTPFAYNYSAIDTNLIKGDPSLKGFRSNSFIKPNQFTRKARTKTQPRYARPALGPDAKESRELDVFHQLNIDPLDEYMNSSLLSHFVTDMGKIRKRAETQLTWKNQRRLGKAIRRAKMMGIIPVLSRRPLSLSNEPY